MRIRFHCLFAAGMLALASAHADDTAARQDHYDPVRLNEFALKKIREGDTGTAAILLERAALLAPHDMRIRQNLETLHAWQAGGPAPSASAAPALESAMRPVSPAALSEDGLPPFPLWPKR